MTNEILLKELVGKTILHARYMTQKEYAKLGWSEPGIYFVLDNGTQCSTQSDPEGNGPGNIYLTTIHNKEYIL